MNRRDDFKRATQPKKAWWWCELSRSMKKLVKRATRRKLKQEVKP